MSPRPAPLLIGAGAAWTVLVVAAPVLGLPLVYAAAHLVCHQLPDRSFHVGGGQMAVCARCLGLYLGAVAGGAWALRPAAARGAATRSRTVRVTIVLAAVPTLIVLAAEWLFSVPVGNATRLVAALPLGAVAAWAVIHALEVDWRT